MSDVEPLSGAYCKEHDIYCCPECVPKTTSIGQTSDGYHTFDELYEHRIALFLALCVQVSANENTGYVWYSRLHSDGSAIPGWFVMGIGTKPGEQITYHMADDYWPLTEFCQTLDRAPEWDGHSPADVLTRLRSVAKQKYC